MNHLGDDNNKMLLIRLSESAAASAYVCLCAFVHLCIYANNTFVVVIIQKWGAWRLQKNSKTEIK